MRLKDYRPSESVDVLLKLIAAENSIHEDEYLGMVSAVIALVDHETDYLYEDSEIAARVGQLMQGYLSEWMRDPW